MIGDQVQLESVKSEGQFLHCSRFLYRDKKSIEGPISTEEGRFVHLFLQNNKVLDATSSQQRAQLVSYSISADNYVPLFSTKRQSFQCCQGTYVLSIPPPSTLIASFNSIGWQYYSIISS